MVLDDGADSAGDVGVAANSVGCGFVGFATAIRSELKMLLSWTRPSVGVASRRRAGSQASEIVGETREKSR